MAYKDIVVYLDVGEDCAACLRTAINIAAKHQARLIGVDISTKEALGESRDQGWLLNMNSPLRFGRLALIFNITRHGRRLIPQSSFFPIVRTFW
jgi:hypothetical protein